MQELGRDFKFWTGHFTMWQNNAQLCHFTAGNLTIKCLIQWHYYNRLSVSLSWSLFSFGYCLIFPCFLNQEREFKDSMLHQLQKFLPAQGQEDMVGSAENLREFQKWYLTAFEKKWNSSNWSDIGSFHPLKPVGDAECTMWRIVMYECSTWL